MNILLKKAIVDWVFENRDVFSLTNATTDHFKEYVYDSKGEYLMGGGDVADFIKKAVELV